MLLVGARADSASLGGVTRVTAALALLLALAGAATARAASLQQVGAFDQPIYVTSPPANPDRLFVVERQGRIVQVQNGSSSTFADISDLVSTDGEGGLLSVAPAPDFGVSGRLYLYYTGIEEVPAEIHVAEMREVGSTAPDSTLRNLLTIPHPSETNHYGGQLQIGPDGHLYVATGDGGGSNDPMANAQDLGSVLGKILRIDPDPSGLLPYTVPAGNPFPAAASPADTIWSYGLRNPFRFSFDRASGAIWIGDVGQGAWEEVDFAAPPGLGAGANYGWSCREGLVAGKRVPPDPLCAANEAGGLVNPVFVYPHEDPEDGGAFGCAVIGGYLVRDPNLGDLYGRYLYGDLCTGRLRSFNPVSPAATDRFEGLTLTDLNSFGEDSCGRIYAVSGAGRALRLEGPGETPCSAAASKASSFVGIRAQRRKVKRGKRALITAWVSPCAGRRGEAVKLLRGGRRVATRRLDRACSARFRPRIRRRTSFRATVPEDANYVAATSRKLKLRIDRRKALQRRAGARSR